MYPEDVCGHGASVYYDGDLVGSPDAVGCGQHQPVRGDDKTGALHGAVLHHRDGLQEEGGAGGVCRIDLLSCEGPVLVDWFRSGSLGGQQALGEQRRHDGDQCQPDWEAGLFSRSSWLLPFDFWA